MQSIYRHAGVLKPLAAIVALANAQLAGAVALTCPATVVVDAIEAEDTAETTTLAEALTTLAACDGDSVVTISIDESLVGKTENISGVPYAVDNGKVLTLNGPATGDFTVTVAAADQALMAINESAIASISDINFAGKDAETRSAALFEIQQAEVTFTRVDFDDVISSSNQAAININGYSTSPVKVTIADSNIRDNTGANGVVGSNGGSGAGDTQLEIRNSTFSGNSASSYRGGAVYAFDTDLTVENSVFDGNTANGDSDSSGGGAIYNAGEYSHANTTIRNSTFSNNAAKNYGGAIYQGSLATFVVEDSVFENNSVTAASSEYGTGASAEAHGGALVLDRSTEISISGTRFEGNDAQSAGGAVYIGRSGRNGDVTIEDSTFDSNTTTVNSGVSSLAYGGAIYTDATVDNPYTLALRRSTFSNNQSAGVAGVIYALGAGVGLEIESSTFDGNSGATFSGGLFLAGLDGASIRHTTATGNSTPDTANVASGFIYASAPSGAIVVSHSVFSGNTTGNQNAGNFCVSSEFSSSVELEYSFWDGANNAASGCKPIVSGDGVIVSSADPQLAVLADNGGATKTRYPATDSPLVDAGNASISDASTTDQRGNDRIARGRIDIGAVEYGNLSPVVSTESSAVEAARGESLAIVTADWFSDPEDDALTYAASGLADGLSINEDSGVISGSTYAPGDYTVAVTASDPYGLSATENLALTVTNEAPTLTDDVPASLSAEVGDSISLDLSTWVTDAEGDDISFAASGLPAGVTLTDDVISGTVSTAGTYTISVTATDAYDASVSASVTLTVTEAAGTDGGSTDGGTTDGGSTDGGSTDGGSSGSKKSGGGSFGWWLLALAIPGLRRRR
ncbi:putative Ig domain-containing protein [Thalassolituus sp. LLYu03]|uniref:putative Ig domain-containing protein n=1 Tax=Thalassolituus sp. LLYu03 TaxID=3421656 RepID=UPI003D27435A